MDPDDLLSVTEAAEYLGLTRQAIHLLTKRHGMGRRIGTMWVFTRRELDEWRDKPRHQGGRPPKANAGTLIKRAIPA